MGRVFQFGDVARRLVRGLQLQGRDQFSAAEEIIPVVIAQDASALVYAGEPRSGAGFGDVTGAAGQQSTHGITNEADGIFHLTRMVISVGNTGFVEVSRSGLLQTAVAPTATKRLIDVSSPTGGVIASQPLPILISSWANNIATGPSIAEQMQVSNTAAIVFYCDHLLRRGETTYVKTQSSAVRLVVGFAGMYYPSAATS